jgi:YD repeat-containing protein
MVKPGNNASSSITVSYSYGTSPKMGQLLSVTDGLSHTSNFTYDSQGNLASFTDAVGNATYWGNSEGLGGYNIANQNILLTYPATGESGIGDSGETTRRSTRADPKFVR